MIPCNISLHWIFTFGPLQNLHLGISNLVKECRIVFPLSGKRRLNPDKLESQRILLCTMQNALLRAHNSIPAAIKEDYFVCELHVEFSKEGTEKQLNELFVAGVQLMTEGNNYQNMEMVLPFLARFVERCS